MHAFRYKGDPKSYPKVVGPMAQEVEKKFPGMVKRQGGKLTVSPAIMPIPGALAGSMPPSSPLVAAGVKPLGPHSLASFMPPKRAFGAATSAMPRRFESHRRPIQHQGARSTRLMAERPAFDARTELFRGFVQRGMSPQQAMGSIYGLMGESGTALDPNSQGR